MSSGLCIDQSTALHRGDILQEAHLCLGVGDHRGRAEVLALGQSQLAETLA